ncbi:lysophospholipid acyltransferase family protein [Flagellimonas sp. DF-77]|uniref:lysophospholipid acyltransferase family protein n=1 Tax=Flagellimonas algarum TaxID=3230298 RepID=UPI003394842C
MRLGYAFVKLWVRTGLFCYYRRVRIHGHEQVPKDRALLFLSNHQNALMDVLLLATSCGRDPWFLARADIFQNAFGSLFKSLHMIPIYRIRDGKQNLAKNNAIFDQCGALLKKGEAILIFPEANHSLNRRIRPLSKGFTRIAFNALETDADLDIVLVPVGQNYRHPTQVGDSAALHFGTPIAVPNTPEPKSAKVLTERATQALRELTVHIPEERDYEAALAQIETQGWDVLQPQQVNAALAKNGTAQRAKKTDSSPSPKPAKWLFDLINLPWVLLWRLLVRPLVPEPEFKATFRFVFALLAYPIGYGAALLLLSQSYSLELGLIVLAGHVSANLFLVKVVGLT